jgi:hypothetical protein
MAKTAIATLKTWFETGDKPTQSQFENFLDSFHHLDGGKVITNVAITGTEITLTLSDASTVVIPIYTLPDMPIGFITGLQAALDNKVDKITGKGLSTEDFTTALKTKLDSLVNYVHPATHEVSEVNGLQGALDGKLDATISRKRKIDGFWVDTFGNTDVDAIEVGNIKEGTIGNRYIIAEVIALPHTTEANMKFYIDNERQL